ncbi:MAG: hypothetical protein ACQSGP_03735 [Frankia sp.]
MPVVVVGLFGAGAAAGLLLLIGALRPRRPDLSALSAPVAPADPDPGGGGGWELRLGGWLTPRIIRPGNRIIRPPVDDLRVVGRPVELWLAQKIVLGLLGLAAPALLAVMAAVAGVAFPPVVPAFAAVGLAVVLFLLPDWTVRAAASEARAEFRRAVAIYIGWVAMARAATGGPAESLERAATVGHGWALTIINRALIRARYGSATPWQALAELGRTYGVPDLDDLAAIVSTAGAGASIYDSLTSKQQALMAADLSADKARANERSERMDFPVVVLLLSFVILLGYPLIANLH